MKANNLELFLKESFSDLQKHWKNTNDNGRLADTLIVSMSDGTKRARVTTFTMSKGDMTEENGERTLETLLSKLQWASSKFDNPLKWLRIEWAMQEKELAWVDFKTELKRYKRNYYRSGIAFEGKREPWLLLTEMELNANACLYLGHKTAHAGVNQTNLETYIRARHGSSQIPKFSDEMPLIVFNTEGVFLDAETKECFELETKPRNKGRRSMLPFTSDSIKPIINQATTYLAKQVQASGQYVYGYFPCFNRTINTYNSLRHASSTYALIEGYEAYRTIYRQQQAESAQEISKQILIDIEASIDNALRYLTEELVQRYDDNKAYVIDTGGEIKLGANAVAILALVKYIQVFDKADSAKLDTFYALTESLALGILAMQQQDGSFVHVLNSKDLTLKQKNRIIYYDGEAAFALMRLYGLTKDERWLSCIEKAFDYFIEAKHYRAHDHWLSYCSNELVIYKPEKKYFQFAVDNIKGYTDFIKNRITTFPTLLELSMAFHKMLLKLDEYPQYQDVLEGFDIQYFYQALHARANYLINGFFFPEVAMFFKAPDTILHGFFIRHHSFRVRIDDVEHYLSGLVAYSELLARGDYPKVLTGKDNKGLNHKLSQTTQEFQEQELEPAVINRSNVSSIAWGGDVNLGRRQHYLTEKYGVANILKIPVLVQADFSLINLECVVSVLGEQGRAKGEGGPYYYRARPEMVEVLRSSGINAVACANNHSGDYGSEALLQQQQILGIAGIKSVGTGINKQAAFEPIYQKLANGVRLAIFSVDATIKHFAATKDKAGAAYINPREHQLWTQTYTSLFKEAKNQADLILVAIHWGANGRATPDKDEYEIGHRLIEAGADAILGASAHQLQGIEIYNGKPIIHDAGDLLFDSVVSKPKPGGVFQLDISQSGIERVRFYPVQVGFGQAWQAVGNIAIDASRQFASLCLAMDTDVTLHEDGSLSIPLDISATKYSKEQKSVLKLEVLSDKGKISRLDSIDYSQWSAQSRTDLVMDTVPEDARIEPVTFGEMELIGIRTRPKFFNRRRMLWVESFWRINKAVSEDIRVHFRAKPTFESDKMRSWGIGTDHDPCDWLIPTSKWQVGKVYRDFYGLRPPYKRAWEDGTLQLQVRVLAKDNVTAFTQLPYTYVLNLNEFSYRGALPIDSNYCQKFADKVYEQHSKGTWNATQLEAVTGGTWLKKPPKDWYVDSLVAGPKHVHMAEGRVMFVANTTEHRHRHEGYAKKPKFFDRHKYVAIKQKELAGAIVSQPVEGIDDPDFPILQVDDPIKAWIELGIAARSRYSNPVIGITGTVGKSSSSAMLKKMLGDDKKILMTLDNYNSRVGIPGMLASLSPSHDAAIIEISQGALWQKSGPISQLVRPNIALVTEIGLTQTRVVKTIEQAVDYKCRIFNGLSGDAIAVVGSHLPLFEKVLGYANKYAKKIVIYGDHPDSDIKIKYIKGDYRGSEVSLETKRGNYKFTLQVPTEGLAKSAIAAFAVVYAMGGDLNKACKQIEQYKSIDGRMQSYDIPLSQGKVTLIDDNWNAAYDSMINAFSLFNNKGRRTGRLIFVLGRLVDMGDKAKEIHQNLAEPLLKSQPDLVITHGQEMQYLRDVLPNEILGEHFENVTALSSYIKSLWKNNDVILIKGSSNHSDFPKISKFLREPSPEMNKIQQATEASKPVEKNPNFKINDMSTNHVLSAKSLAYITGGYWINEPDTSWRATGLCVWGPTFYKGNVVVVRKKGANKGGVLLKNVNKLELKGASALICTQPELLKNSNLPKLVVEDNFNAIEVIGKLCRIYYSGTVIGVTGSVGKTTSVAVISQFLANHGDVGKSRFNGNTHRGISWNIASMPQSAKYWCLEASIGNMPFNAELVQPDIAVVTNISEGHMDQAKSLMDVAKRKSQLFDYMKPKSLAIINRDIEYYDIFAKKAEIKQLKIVTFGRHSDADIRLLSINGSKVKISIEGKAYILQSKLPDHLISNGLCGLAVIHAMGLPIELALNNFESLEPLHGRGKINEVTYQGKEIKVIDDAYNATPESMRAGINYLCRIEEKSESRVAIIGDIAHLGDDSVNYHIALKDVLIKNSINRIVLCGALMKHLYDALKSSNYQGAIYWYENADQLIADLNNLLIDDDTVFVKGSTPSKMQKVVWELTGKVRIL